MIRLAPGQTIEHVQHLLASHGAGTDQGAEDAGGDIRRQAPLGGEFGIRGQGTGDDSRQHQLTLAAKAAAQ